MSLGFVCVARILAIRSAKVTKFAKFLCPIRKYTSRKQAKNGKKIKQSPFFLLFGLVSQQANRSRLHAQSDETLMSEDGGGCRVFFFFFLRLSSLFCASKSAQTALGERSTAAPRWDLRNGALRKTDSDASERVHDKAQSLFFLTKLQSAESMLHRPKALSVLRHSSCCRSESETGLEHRLSLLRSLIFSALSTPRGGRAKETADVPIVARRAQ